MMRTANISGDLIKFVEPLHVVTQVMMASSQHVYDCIGVDAAVMC